MPLERKVNWDSTTLRGSQWQIVMAPVKFIPTFHLSLAFPHLPYCWRGQKSQLEKGEKILTGESEETQLAPPPVRGFSAWVIAVREDRDKIYMDWTFYCIRLFTTLKKRFFIYYLLVIRKADGELPRIVLVTGTWGLGVNSENSRFEGAEAKLKLLSMCNLPSPDHTINQFNLNT